MPGSRAGCPMRSCSASRSNPTVASRPPIKRSRRSAGAAPRDRGSSSTPPRSSAGSAARARRPDRGRGRGPELLRAARHQHHGHGHHHRGEPRHAGGGALQLSRPKGRGAHPHRVLSPVPKLDHRCVQQRAPLHRPARRPGGVRTAGGPPQRGRRADLLTALDALDPQLLTRARGAVLGLVVGNQLGVPTERLGTAKAIREAFPQGVRDLAPPPKGSPFDDDAALALLLAESLAERGDFDAADVAERWVKWMKRDGRGIGLTTQRALRFVERGMEPFEAGRAAHDAGTAASNGSVMRCIPVALRYHDNVDKLVRVSAQQAAITHADERCTWGAVAVNLAARELLHGNRHCVEEVLHCVELAFWCALHGPSLEEALVFLVEEGGDTDTNAAVAGALLGARDGEASL